MIDNMFEKKEIIFSETLGVCQVFEITKLAAKNGEQVMYYGLRSIADKKKVSYIPVDHHKVLLRPLITYEEALKLKENCKADDNTFTQEEIAEADYVISVHGQK